MKRPLFGLPKRPSRKADRIDSRVVGNSEVVAGVLVNGYQRVAPSRFEAGLILATLITAISAGPVPSSLPTTPIQKARVAENYGKIPLTFEANDGQADKSVKFLARGGAYELYLTGNETALMLCKPVFSTSRANFRRNMSPVGKSAACDVVRMQLAGASNKVEPVGEERLPGTVNHFIGKDPANWRSNIPTYAKVRYPSIYPGIDLVYYGNQRQIEFDFVVAPSGDSRSIQLRFSGVRELLLTANGDVVATAARGTLALHKPLVYQIVEQHRHFVAGNFALLGNNTLGFRLGNYDRTRPLVIDPALAYSTFLGGSGMDVASAIALDSTGNAYVAGRSSSVNFPITSGAFQTSAHGTFVSKLNASGTALIYSTYLGGSGTSVCGGDSASGLAVDSSGNAYVTGFACSTDFPVTPGAFQTTNKAAAAGNANAFVTKLNSTGTALVYSTYLGGSGLATETPSGGDEGSAIAVDAGGDAFVAGQTYSPDFPITAGAFQTNNNGSAKNDSNAFISKLSPSGSTLLYSTFLGGSGASRGVVSGDSVHAIAVDAAGNAYVVGYTFSADFPVTPEAFQTANNAAPNLSTNLFITKLNPTGAALIYSTYLGGSPPASVGPYVGDSGNAIAVDDAGGAYVAGLATSTDFPVTQGAFQATNRNNTVSTANAFVTKLNATGTALAFSTYLGGSGGIVNLSPTLFVQGGDQVEGLAVDPSGNVYVTGSTASSDFPVTSGAYQAMNNDQPGCAGGCIGGYNAFITELNSTGSALVYSTYLGGNGVNPAQSVGIAMFGPGDQANALALDSSGNVYIVGSACSSDFPVTGGAFQKAFQKTLGSDANTFVAKLNFGPSFTITGTAVTVPPGATTANTSTITVTPADGFTGSASLTAAVTSGPGPSGAPNPPTFSFGSTSPVNITGPSAGTATLTISTTAAGSCLQARQRDGDFPWYPYPGATFACVVLFSIPASRRRRRTVLGIMALLILVTGGLLSCSSGRSICNGTPGTTPGTYTIAVTGTSGTITASGTVILTVQ